MGWLRRNGRPNSSEPAVERGDLGTLLLQGEDMIEQLAQAHMSWGLGSADRWSLDQRTGTITWTFPDRTATAPAQIIGSYNPSATSWLWAWANESILPEMSRDSVTVREWGEAHLQSALTQPKIDNADEPTAARLGALAVRITQATGYYRGTGSPSIPIITFGAITLTTKDGKTSTFTINVS
jgi:uncharacterized protein DUF6882